jgi:hypothetical protein
VSVAQGNLGNWAFIVGVIVAIIAGLFGTDIIPFTASILVVLGIVVGFMNIGTKKKSEFLIAAVALMVAGAASLSALNVLPTIGGWLIGIVTNVIVFVAPAALVVALQDVYNLAAKS